MTALIWSLGGVISLVFLGEMVSSFFPSVKKIRMPGAVVGGLIGLLIGPQVFDLLSGLSLDSERIKQSYESIRSFPVLFINAVFACLMLGRRIDSFRSIWRRARNHIVLGHILAWGQYVVGLLLTLILLKPFFSVNELAGASIAIGFQGGHGTAAGLTSNYEQLNFSEGKTIALTIATFGILFGTVLFPLIANFLARKHPVKGSDQQEESKPKKSKQSSKKQRSFSPLTGKLTMHLGLVLLVIGIAKALLVGLQSIETALRSESATMIITEYIPLFSVVLVVGMITQLILQKMGWTSLFRRSLFARISSFSLDMVIASALATLTLSVISTYWIPITVLTLGGITWNLVVFFVLGPKLFNETWYAHALGDLGGGTATTASGFMLIRVADPHQKTSARNAYAEKQPFYEPIMGGGLVTAMALPVIATQGALFAVIVTTIIAIGWISYALLIIKRSVE